MPVVLILVMAITTMVLRMVPFYVFSNRKTVPDWLMYLPAAVLGMLVVYCLKASTQWMEWVAVLIVVLVQCFKHNTILSIVSGTFCYMFLLHL